MKNIKKILYTKIKYILFFIFIIFCDYSSAQAYLGHTNQDANIRIKPGFEDLVLKTLPLNTTIFIVTLKTDNNYYHVIDIESNIEGYVFKDLITIDEVVQKNPGSIFSSDGYNSEYAPIISVINSTDLQLSLKLNNTNYSIGPLDKRTITLSPGDYDFIASSPGVIPDYGNAKLVANEMYSLTFYIINK